MNEKTPHHQRLEELLADQTLFGLTSDEHIELQRLLASSAVDPEQFERIAAISCLAFQSDSIEPLPDTLKQKVLESSVKWVSPPKEHNPSSRPPLMEPLPRAVPRVMRILRQPHPREMISWLIATASLFVMLVLWRALPPAASPPMTMAEARSKLIKTGKGVTQVPWKTTNDLISRNVSGDVVWSNISQKGFLRLNGLPVNDAGISQYQVWIFDGQKDDRFPVDGGVFNIDSHCEEVVIPINAKLRVEVPKLFAITIEKPGGVVVSNRERLLLIAKVPDAQPD